MEDMNKRTTINGDKTSFEAKAQGDIPQKNNDLLQINFDQFEIVHNKRTTINRDETSFEENAKAQGDIPQKYKDSLQTVLDQMETETGSMYQFTVNKFGNPSNYNCIVGDFGERNSKIQVYDMDPAYQELEGIYQNRKDIENRIQEYCWNNPAGRYHSKWQYMRVDKYDGSIWTGGGGSISICEHKGKYKFIGQ